MASASGIKSEVLYKGVLVLDSRDLKLLVTLYLEDQIEALEDIDPNIDLEQLKAREQYTRMRDALHQAKSRVEVRDNMNALTFIVEVTS